MTATYTVQPITDYSIFTTARSQRKPIQFKASWSATLDELDMELIHLGARDVVLEMAVDAKHIRLDGQLRADAKPTHPGVRVSFQTRKHGELSYTCDTYERLYAGQMPSWQANVRAIVKTLQSLRAVDRYGATKGEQYSGFKALGAGSGATPMGVEPAMTHDQALTILTNNAQGAGPTDGFTLEQLYRRARARCHPDRHEGQRALWDQVEKAATALGLSA